MLTIRNLHAINQGKPILKGLNLQINPGEIHALMGPNGAGKSTLAKVLAGHPAYEITDGEVLFQNKNLLEMAPEERAQEGLFLSFQYPPEIAGVTTFQFLFRSYNAVHKDKACTEAEFEALLEEKMRLVEMRSEFKERSVNEGFSGGEKKRSEILQMATLEPKLSILDETDSGLDIDAMRVVACGVKKLMTPLKALLLITHYQRLLDYLTPHFVHVFVDGKIVRSGGPKLALELEKEGYDSFH